jgi:hypothetical protein
MLKMKEYLKAGGFSSAAATTLLGAYFIFIVPQFNSLSLRISKLEDRSEVLSSEIASVHLSSEGTSMEHSAILADLQKENERILQNAFIIAYRLYLIEDYISKKDSSFTLLPSEILQIWR